MAARPGSLAFVREVVAWSAGVAVTGLFVSVLVTRGWRFPVSFALGAAFDIGTIVLVLRRAPGEAGSFAGAGNAAAALVAGRLVLKTALLALAVAIPAALDIWGMAAGVLVFETTLMTVGSYKAAVATRAVSARAGREV